MTAAVTLPVTNALSRSGPLPTCTSVTSLPGVSPTFRSAKRAMESVAEPNRLIARVPPLSCSVVLTPCLPIST